MIAAPVQCDVDRVTKGSRFARVGPKAHALLGGVVIGALYNGLGLLGIGAAGTDVATALVLLAAVTVDSLLRRRAA
jgi:D-xylose transport system permease protein